MRIKINGYKNIDNFDYELEDDKLNIIVGISGSGKSSIIGALTNDDIEFNKTLNNSAMFNVDIDKPFNIEELKIFTEFNINNYLFSSEKNSYVYDVIIDDNNELQNISRDLEKSLENLNNAVNENVGKYNDLSNIKKQLSISLNKNNTIRKSSAIHNMRSTLNKVGVRKLYEKLENLDDNHAKWLIDGSKFIFNSTCPYCEKTLGNSLEKKLKSIGELDLKSQKSLNLNEEQLQLINQNPILLTIKYLNIFEKDVTNMVIALNEYDKFISNLNSFSSLEKYIDQFDFNYKNCMYVYFPNIETLIKDFKKHKSDFKIIQSKARSRTKKILNRRITLINELLEQFGIPYNVEATYSQNKITNYKIFHKKDSNKISREKGLSTGERKIISLIFFVLEVERKNTKLIILDDPISSYDENRRSTVFSFIYKRLIGKTVLILSHDQLFAKLALNSLRLKIGKVSYFENFSKPEFQDIEKTDFENISIFIRKQVKDSKNYIQKIINLRYYYEINKKRLVNSYLSAIIHREFDDNIFNPKVENQILKTIKKDLRIDLVPFNNTYYENIDTRSFSLIEKIFLLRELDISKKQQDELNNLVHLNSKFAITLNPYKFSFCSNYINDLVAQNITKNFNFQ